MALFNINIYSNDKDLIRLLKENNLKLDNIMATLTELSTKVDELQTALDAEQVEIQEAIAKLEASITDLSALVADGGTAEERQAISDKLTQIKTDLEGTIPSKV